MKKIKEVNLDDFIKGLDPRYPTCFDVETTGFKFYEKKMFGFSLVQLKPKPKKIFYRIDDKEKHHWYMPLKLFLANPDFKKIWFNGKFDWQFIINEGLTVVNNHEDILIKAFLCNENWPSYKLFNLSKMLLGEKDKDVIKSFKLEAQLKEYLSKIKSDNYADVPNKNMHDYGIGDGILTLRLSDYLDENYWSDDYQKIYNIENKMLEILTFMEYDGVDIDIAHVRKLEQEFLVKRQNALEDIYSMDLGYKFEDTDQISAILNSSPKLGKLLYEEFGLKDELNKIRYTPGGRYCTDDLAIKSIIKANVDTKFVEFLELKIEYTKTAHNLSTFIEPYLTTGLQYGKVYPSYNQTVTRSGRLSCWHPNMQHLPKRDEEIGDKIRFMILNPDSNNLDLGNLDYSQVELRLLAHYCKDEAMIKGFHEGFDFHTWTANELGVKRRDAKDVNFAIWYGIGIAGLAKKLDKSKQFAKKFRNDYFEKFPNVKLLMSQCQMAIKKRGFVKTFYGRRCRLPIDKAYIATNRVIQGTAAEVLKLAMIRLWNEFRSEVKIKIPVHDEIVYLKEKGKFDKQIKELMEDYSTFRVPLTIDMQNFKGNWGITNGTKVIF